MFVPVAAASGSAPPPSNPRPGGARLLRGHSASSLPPSLPPLPSSFPSSPSPPPPPRTAGRETSSGQQPGEAAGPGLAGPARTLWPLGGGWRAGFRPRRARALGLFPRASLPPAGPSRRRRVLPRPPPRGAPRPGPWASLAPPPLAGPRNRCHAAFPHSSDCAAMPKLFPGRGRGGGSPLQVPAGRST